MPSNQYDLSFIARFVNKLSKGMARATHDISKFGKETREAGSDAKIANESWKSVAHTLGTVGKIGAAIVGTGTAISAWAIKASLDMDSVLAEIAVKMDTNLGDTQKRIEGLRKTFKKLSADSGLYDMTDIAQAYATGVAMFGDLMDMPIRLEKAVDASFRARSKSVDKTMDLIAQTMKAFGDTTLETFDRVALALPVVMQKGNLSFEEMSNSLARAAPLGADMNMTIEEMLALYIKLSRIVGGKASLVGFQLASLFQNLGIKEDVVEILKLVNAETKKVGSKYYGQSGLIVLLKAIAEFGKDPANLRKFFESIGARGKVAAVTLIRPEDIKETENLLKILMDTEGLAAKFEKDMTLLTTGRFKAMYEYGRLTKTFQSAREELGNILKNLATPWFEEGTKSLEIFITKLEKTKSLLGAIAAGITSMGPLFLKALFGIPGQFQLGIPGLLTRGANRVGGAVGGFSDWFSNRIQGTPPPGARFLNPGNWNVDKSIQVVGQGLNNTVGVGLERIGEMLVEAIHGRGDVYRFIDPNNPAAGGWVYEGP